MSQISPPIRILLVAVIGLVAAYMLFLRPKEAAVPAAPPAATTPVPAKDPNAQTNSKPGAAVQQAVRGADNASARADEAAGGAISDVEGGAAADPATGINTNPAAAAPATGETSAPPAITKKVLRSLPKDVRAPVKNRKVLALLFYNNRSDDDRAVRRELDRVDRYGKQVFVDAHWIKSVGRYEAITRGVSVDQSPTVVVVDRNLKAETLVGFHDAKTIDQAVVDALRASGGSTIKDPYFRQLDAICVSAEQQSKALTQPASAAAVPTFLAGLHAISVDGDAKVRGVKPPKKRVKFHRAFYRNGVDATGIVGIAMNDAKANPAKSVSVLRAASRKLDRNEDKFLAQHGAHGLSCF
jgi:hypothetical protein